ncbi:MAG: hypothetical protein IT393_07860 [Nitrospirae bacterium]|nr:hypothetical protein [Nitrospirota bacterium]
MNVFLSIIIMITLMAAQPVKAYEAEVKDIVQIGSAFATNLTVHEYGHAIVGSSVGAEGISVSFMSKRKNNLFLGYTSTKRIDDDAYPSFALGGEIGANMSFEYALYKFRKAPTTYNRALLFFSGTDFLWYSVYAFYFNEDNPDSDPNILHRETGISKDAILAAAITQSVLNGYRVYAGSDTVVPYMTFSSDSIGFHLRVSF